MTARSDHDPKPVARALAVRRAERLRARCPTCLVARPLSPVTGQCWPCDNLVSEAYPNGATDRQACNHGQLCNDCAFRPQSPEAEPFDADRAMQFMHVAMPGNSDRSPASTREVVIAQAKHGSGIFWCHKPFLEPQQQWGYNPKTRELTPLDGEHWRPCGGWIAVFKKEHEVACS